MNRRSFRGSNHPSSPTQHPAQPGGLAYHRRRERIASILIRSRPEIGQCISNRERRTKPMAEGPTVLMNFKEFSPDEELRESVEARCRELAKEFHEITRFEFTLVEDRSGFTAHGHVTGKNTDVSTHATASKLAPATDQLLDKVERQLRRAHDKRIFSARRDAQRDPQKRKNAS